MLSNNGSCKSCLVLGFSPFRLIVNFGDIVASGKNWLISLLTEKRKLPICSSGKYPYFLYGRDFFAKTQLTLTPLASLIEPLWKFQLSFIHFFKFYGLTEPSTPQEIQSLLWGEHGHFLEQHNRISILYIIAYKNAT